MYISEVSDWLEEFLGPAPAERGCNFIKNDPEAATIADGRQNVGENTLM